jgi:hypothetical protein
MPLFASDRKWRSREALTVLIGGHLTRYPAAEPRDIYKLLYQGTLGPEHLVESVEEFEARLLAELEEIQPDENEPLWDPLRPDGLLGRLNLRSFKARGGDPARLLEACLRTSFQRWGTPEDLKRAWDTYSSLARQGTWPSMSPGRIDILTRYLILHDYPPMQHSTMFRRSYAPAYRVIAARWTGMLLVLGLPSTL